MGFSLCSPMADILCTFRLGADGEEQYFVTDPNVTAHQFTKFVRQNLCPQDADAPYTIHLNGALLENDSQLENAFASGINVVAYESVPEQVEEEEVKEVEEVKESVSQQSAVKSVLARFGIPFDDDASPVEMIRLLPFLILQGSQFDALAMDTEKVESTARAQKEQEEQEEKEEASREQK